MAFSFDFTLDKNIQYGDQLIFFGSCFSEDIGQKAKNAGLNVYMNPFGVIYNPLALANLLHTIISKEPFRERILQREDVFLDWSCAGTVYAMSKESLSTKLNHEKNTFKQKLKSSKVLFITFGTSYSYYLKETQDLVANCHKQPADKFEKRLESMENMLHAWKELLVALKTFNPSIQIVLTVSPVRHVKDGVIQNNRSKSRLLLLCEELEKENSIFYFPSYEVILDDLRDYSFYKTDLVHPNERAIEYVWELFKNNMIEKEDLRTMEEVLDFKKKSHHKILYPESKKSKEFILHLEEAKKKLLNQNPLICL